MTPPLVEKPSVAAGDLLRATPWYQVAARAPVDFPALAGEITADVAVLGGGLTGLSAALDLAEAGFTVALVEAGRLAEGASGRNGGQIVTGFNRANTELAAALGRDDGARLVALGEAAKDLIRERVARHAIACDLTWGFVGAAAKARHVAEMEEVLADWQAAGYDQARLVDRAGLKEHIASERYHGGLIDPGGGHLQPVDYVHGLARASAAAGVQVFERTRVERIEHGRQRRLVTRATGQGAAGSVRAEHIVLAGNAYFDVATDLPRIDTAILPVTSHVLVTEPLGEARAAGLLPRNEAVSDSFNILNYFRLTADRRLLFGGGVGYAGGAAARDIAGLRRQMLWVFPSLSDVAIEHAWSGRIAITLSRLPRLDRPVPGVYVAQGFSGHGVALTGIAGRVIARAIAGDAADFDIMARLKHRPFPGGRRFRVPALVLAMLWYRLLDLLP